jgi:hypothetical protein
MSGDLDIIKAGLKDRVRELCERLLPHGREEGGLWVAHNPLGDDARKPPALKVRIRGGDLGAWRDWRGGDKGDVIGLVAYVERTDVSGALTWSRDWLGLRAMSRADREAMRRVERARAQKRQADDDRRRADKLVMADRLFSCSGDQARDIGPAAVPHGTFPIDMRSAVVDHAWGYFAGRSVPLGQVANLNRKSFRVSPATEWWKGTRWARDQATGRRWKDEAGPLFPAVHSAMRNRMGIVTCCHVTFLDPVRPAKAPVTPAKLMFGEALGAVIEISTGPSGVPFWMADRDGLAPCPLILAEGIETALSFATTIPEARVWAGGSLAGVGGAPVDLDCVEWVLFARDNNDGNAQAQKQFSAALEKLEASGKRVHVEASHVGDDFNDLAQGDE